MAKHEVLIHETRNITGDGTTLYTGSYIEKESVRQAGFVGFLSAKSGLPAVQAQAILEGSFEAVKELEKESLVRIHTDLGTICGIITGSFETADAAFDPEKNTLELAIRLEDELKLSLADVVPTIVTDESLTKLRVDGLMDLETPRPYNLIHGQKVFRVSCFNMVHEDEGATVFLQDAKGVTFPVVVDKVVSKQLFEGHTAELLEPGDYKLVAKSRAGDAEGPLQTAFHRVKYLKVGNPNAPKITRVVSNIQEETLRPSCAVEIAGEHLADATVKVSHVKGGVTKEVELMPSLVDAREDKIGIATDWYEEAGLTSDVTRVTFTVVTPNGSVSHESPFEGE